MKAAEAQQRAERQVKVARVDHAGGTYWELSNAQACTRFEDEAAAHAERDRQRARVAAALGRL